MISQLRRRSFREVRGPLPDPQPSHEPRRPWPPNLPRLSRFAAARIAACRHPEGSRKPPARARRVPGPVRLLPIQDQADGVRWARPPRTYAERRQSRGNAEREVRGDLDLSVRRPATSPEDLGPSAVEHRLEQSPSTCSVSIGVAAVGLVLLSFPSRGGIQVSV
jgi:hypothetical protein